MCFNTSILATYTRKVFDLLNPKPEMVCIEDIAHSLAYQCRYTGHTRQFYSVAQHCFALLSLSILYTTKNSSSAASGGQGIIFSFTGLLISTPHTKL